MRKTIRAVLTNVKQKHVDPVDYATDGKLMAVLTIADKNFNNRRNRNGFNNKSNKRQAK